MIQTSLQNLNWHLLNLGKIHWFSPDRDGKSVLWIKDGTYGTHSDCGEWDQKGEKWEEKLILEQLLIVENKVFDFHKLA